MHEFAEIVRRLQDHFTVVDVRPPATDSALRALTSRVRNVPDTLVSLWRYCDGIVVTRFEEGEIFGVEQSLEFFPVCEDADPCQRFLPIRGDGCGDYDCLVLGPGICEGAVVFWDHEVYEGAAYLLGGSLQGYFDMWADHMVRTYLPDGQKNPRSCPPKMDAWPWVGTPEYQHPWPFDESWMGSRDRLAQHLLSDPASRRWLLRQDSPS